MPRRRLLIVRGVVMRLRMLLLLITCLQAGQSFRNRLLLSCGSNADRSSRQGRAPASARNHPLQSIATLDDERAFLRRRQQNPDVFVRQLELAASFDRQLQPAV